MKLKIYIENTKFTSHKQHLLGRLFSANAKNTHTDQIILQYFYSVLKETTHKPSKAATAKKNIFPVRILLIHLAPINVFYSI